MDLVGEVYKIINTRAISCLANCVLVNFPLLLLFAAAVFQRKKTKYIPKKNFGRAVVKNNTSAEGECPYYEKQEGRLKSGCWSPLL